MLPCRISVYADEKSLMHAAEMHYADRDYYFCVTETMRCMHLYPEGNLFYQALLLQSRALFKSGDRAGAIDAVDRCVSGGSGSAADEALFLSGRMRLLSGNSIFAVRRYDMYLENGSGVFYEDAIRDKCWAYAFSGKEGLFADCISEYRKLFPAGKYLKDIDMLETELVNEMNRPKKNVTAAVAGSVFLPGFGYFYTGNYFLGSVTFLTNLCLIGIAVDGFIRGNIFQWAFFGMMELSFYTYSLNGAKRSAEEYNGRKNFTESLKIKFEAEF